MRFAAALVLLAPLARCLVPGRRTLPVARRRITRAAPLMVISAEAMVSLQKLTNREEFTKTVEAYAKQKRLSTREAPSAISTMGRRVIQRTRRGDAAATSRRRLGDVAERPVATTGRAATPSDRPCSGDAELAYAGYLLDPDKFVLDAAAADKLGNKPAAQRRPEAKSVKIAQAGQRRSPLLQAYIDEGGPEVKERIEKFERENTIKACAIIAALMTFVIWYTPPV